MNGTGAFGGWERHPHGRIDLPTGRDFGKGSPFFSVMPGHKDFLAGPSPCRFLVSSRSPKIQDAGATMTPWSICRLRARICPARRWWVTIACAGHSHARFFPRSGLDRRGRACNPLS